MSILPKTPGPNCGLTSPRTLSARGPVPLSADQRRRARFLRFEAASDWPDIAADLGRTERDVRHSLANARSRRTNPPRGTVNVGPAAIERLRSLQQPGEPMWVTVNRLLGI